MGDKEFTSLCKRELLKLINQQLDVTDGITVTEENIYVVWLAKVLQNNKALLSTNLLDGMYYELTYNGDKNELYVDVYKKWNNIKIVL